jgi:hypothetical protein
MKKLLIFKNGDRYFVDDRASIVPAIEPEEEYDITKLDEADVEKLKNKDNKVLKKAIKLK